jgi:hypothetical protein
MAKFHPLRSTKSGSYLLAVPARRSVHRVLAVVAVLGLGLLALPDASLAQVPVLDQSHTAASVSTASFSGASRRGQIFTVGVNGTLARIEVAVSGTNATLAMDLMNVTAGLPGTVLATATNPTDVAAGVKSFDFTSAGVSARNGPLGAYLSERLVSVVRKRPLESLIPSRAEDREPGGLLHGLNDGPNVG